MRHFALEVICILAALLVGSRAASAQCSAGIFNSPKGFGLSVQHQRGEDKFDNYSLFADIYGMPLGRQATPGVHFCFSHNYSLVNRAIGEVQTELYAGPGVSAGWVQDGEFSLKSKDKLVHHPGVMAAMSGTAGIRANFAHNIVLDLSLLCEVGLHIRQDEYMNQKDLTLYANGFTRIWMPQLLILYKFGK